MISKQHPEQIFGEYTLKRKLGVGGMATVYLAVHNKLQRKVAIKIIHEQFVDDVTAIKRLEREAQIAKELKHPNIAPIITFNHVNNRPYLVMPYYAGKTLADYFYHPRAVTHDTSLKILTKLAEGLDYAHSKGVIHRDFKLENILLDKHSQPAISDFGIAQVANTTRLTATGHFLGTPQYMAPEQASRAYDEIDYRADLYAFGVMAYLMLTGVFPFTAADPIHLILKHTTQEVPIPTLVNSELPKATDGVLIRALAKEPEYRFPSAIDFANSLEIALKNIAPITTLVEMQKPNPIEPMEQGGIATRKFTEDLSVISADDETTDILEAQSQPKRRSPVLIWILLLFVLGGIGTTILLGLGGNNPVSAFTGLNSEGTEETVAENTEDSGIDDLTAPSIATDVTASTAITETVSTTITTGPSSTPSATDTASPTNTNTATRTPSPTKTPTLTRTVRPTNTTRPTNTPRPLPTNTPVPPPTSVPVQPTNVPVQPTSVPNPPQNNNPVQPVVEQVVEPVVEQVVEPVVEDVVAPVVEDVGCILLIGC